MNRMKVNSRAKEKARMQIPLAKEMGMAKVRIHVKSQVTRVTTGKTVSITLILRILREQLNV